MAKILNPFKQVKRVDWTKKTEEKFLDKNKEKDKQIKIHNTKIEINKTENNNKQDKKNNKTKQIFKKH